MKPDVLSDEELREWYEVHIINWLGDFRSKEDRQAQRDADVAYYEPLLEQAQQEMEKLPALIAKSWEIVAQWQSDIDELAIQQAKAEVAREIENFLQMHLYAKPDKPAATMKFADWQKLRKLLSKFLKGKQDAKAD